MIVILYHYYKIINNISRIQHFTYFYTLYLIVDKYLIIRFTGGITSMLKQFSKGIRAIRKRCFQYTIYFSWSVKLYIKFFFKTSPLSKYLFCSEPIACPGSCHTDNFTVLFDIASSYWISYSLVATSSDKLLVVSFLLLSASFFESDVLQISNIICTEKEQKSMSLIAHII